MNNISPNDVPPSQLYLAQLRHLLIQYFNLEEIRTLCFDLNVEFEELGGEGKTAVIRNLILFLKRQNRLEELLKLVALTRPNVAWPGSSKNLADNPYRGLEAFREVDATYFYGREAFVKRLLGVARQNQEIVTVIGPSGSGKSSVVFAGLLPYLRRDGDWLIGQFRPGRRPFHSLATMLVTLLDPKISEVDLVVETAKLSNALQSGHVQLPDVIDRLRQTYPEVKHLLIVVDQFEELYTLGAEPKIRHQFLDTLLTKINQSQHTDFPTKLILTLRADFLGQALMYRPFADALQDKDIKLGPMNGDELRRAIIQPAEKAGVQFEAGLVDRIIEDVVPSGSKQIESGNLPLLEFALTLLWEWQTNNMLTHTAYETIGQVKGALARHAEAMYEELSLSEQEQLQHILIQMVHPGLGTEDTRRLATKEEIGNQGWGLVQRLASLRLVVTDIDDTAQETAELVHEALIQHWGRLRKWTEKDRTFRTWQERLRAARRQWEASEKDEGALLRGIPLAEAEGWFEEREDDLSQQEKVFIQVSVHARDVEIKKREARRQRELEQARQFSELNKRLARMSSRLLIPFIILALLMGIGSAFTVTNFVSGSLQERFNNQLFDAGRIVSEEMIQYEVDWVQTLRLVNATNGVPEALAESDTDTLARLVPQIVANSASHMIVILDIDGTEIYSWQQLPNLEDGFSNENFETDYSSNEEVQRVLNGEVDESGVTRNQILEIYGKPVLFSIGPVSLNGDQIGAVMMGTEMEQMITDLTIRAVARVTLYDKEGRVLATTLERSATSTDGNETTLSSTLLADTSEFYQTVANQADIQFPMQNLEIVGQSYALAFGDWRLRNKSFGMFSVALPTNFMVSSFATSRNLIGFIFSVVIIGIMIVGIFTVRRVISPIRKLADYDFDIQREEY